MREQRARFGSVDARDIPRVEAHVRRAAEGPDLAVAELDEPVDAFPEGFDFGFAGWRRLDRRDRPFARSTRVTRPPHSPLSAPSQTRPARSSRNVVASSSSANVFPVARSWTTE